MLSVGKLGNFDGTSKHAFNGLGIEKLFRLSEP